MKAVVQRVTKASVSVKGELVSSIGRGLCVLIGIHRDDTPKDIEYIVRKILNVRVFEDDQGKRWRTSVVDRNFEILCISQFTLYHILKGNKLDFHLSMSGDSSQEFYSKFLTELQNTYKPDLIKDGVFGAYMQVDIQNDGPVTIELESSSYKQQGKNSSQGANNGGVVDAAEEKDVIEAKPGESESFLWTINRFKQILAENFGNDADPLTSPEYKTEKNEMWRLLYFPNTQQLHLQLMSSALPVRANTRFILYGRQKENDKVVKMEGTVYKEGDMFGVHVLNVMEYVQEGDILRVKVVIERVELCYKK